MVTSAGDDWERFGRALIASMADLLKGVPLEQHPLLLETADYWLALGLVIGLERRNEAGRLLELIETDATERRELAVDAADFCAQVLA